MSLTKTEALVLLDIGKSKTYICKKLKIKPRVLNKWILKDERSDEDKALQMHYLGYSRKKICERLIISKDDFNDYIEASKEKFLKHAIKHDYLLSEDGHVLAVTNYYLPRQNGFSRWNDSLFKEKAQDNW